jgi:hypothetical protein
MTVMPDRTRPPRRSLPVRRARAAAGREDGYVIVVAIAMLAIALAVGAAALGETLSSRSHANRDARVKRALQAADAGIAALLYQQNELPLKNLEWNGGVLGLSTVLDCVVPTLDVNLKVTGVTTATVDAAGVCPDSSGAGKPASGSASLPVGSHAYYQARFIPGRTAPGSGNHTILNPKIVSVGYDDGGNTGSTAGYTVRRVEAILAPIDPFQAIESMGDLTISGIKLAGVSVASTLNGNARTNGDVTLPSVFLNTNLSGGLLGTVTYGNNHNGGPLIPLSSIKKQTSSFTRSPVSIASSKPSCPAADATIPRLANCGNLGAAYVSGTNSFSLSSGTVSIPPGDYVFCNFNATGGTVTANATAAAPVRIFIDSSKSSRCSGNGLGSAQGNFTAANGIGNLLGNTLGATGASGLQIYVVGDQAASPYDNATSVTIGAQPLVLGSGVIQNYVVYAPTSRVNLSNCISVSVFGLVTDTCAAIQGAVIGDDVTIKASVFTQDLDLTSYPLYAGLGAYRVQNYVECPPVYPIPTPDPTTGC